MSASLRSRLAWPALLGALALLAACSNQTPAGAPAASGAGETTGAAKAVSFKTDVAPLLASSCAGCHAAGALGAPQMLLFDASNQVDYNVAKAEIGDIVRQVQSGRMPKGRPALAASQVAILQAWQSAGAPNN